MPQVNVIISHKLDEKRKNDLQLEIGAVMSILPGKNIGNTYISICDGCSMYRDGSITDAAFVDIRLFKASPEESKKDFSKKMFEIFKSVLNIEPDQIYMNFIELEHWVANGEYK